LSQGYERCGVGELWQTLIFEGATNLALVGAVLIWPAMAAVAFVRLTSAWAIVTAALLLAAARRLSLSHGRWLLALAGVVSGVWGALAATVGPSSAREWLIGYSLPFAAHEQSSAHFGQRIARERRARVRANEKQPQSRTLQHQSERV
jgi:hydrogenase/urease accessory protein HupE